MRTFLRQIFSSPAFGDEEKTRVAGLLNILLLACLLGAIIYFVGIIIILPYFSLPNALIVVFAILALVGMLVLMRRGYVQLTSLVLTITLWCLLALASLPDAGLRDPAYGGYILIILVGGFLLGTQAGIILAALSTGLGFIMLILEINGLAYVNRPKYDPFALWASESIFFFMGAVLLHLALRRIHYALSRSRNSEEALRRKNIAYRMLSDCNQALIRATDETALLADICQIIVKRGDLAFAWVGFPVEDEMRTLTPVAYAGKAHTYLDSFHSVGPECDPTLEAMRTGEAQMTKELHRPHCSVVSSYDFDAIIALPLKLDQQIIGTLSVYSSRSSTFDSEGVDLLTELSYDIAYGLETLRARQERQRITMALAEQHQLLRTVIDNIPDVIFLKDAHGRYEVVNRAFSEYTGIRTDEVIGKTVLDIFPSYEGESLHKTDMRQMEEGESLTTLVSRINRETGEQRWLLDTLVPVRDSVGKVTRLLGIARDLTERIQMEEQLRYQANLLENVSDAIVSVDLNFVIQSWNAAAEKMYGIAASEAIGQNSTNIIMAEYPEANRQAIIEQIDTFGRWEGEVIHKRSNGEKMYVAAATSVIRDNHDGVMGLVTVNRDITKQKLAEKALAEHELLQAELRETQQLSEARNRFVSMVSHEFRTPLTVIELSTDMIERYWDRMDIEKKQVHVRNIRSQVKRLDGLLADFTLAMRAESGHLNFTPAPLNLEQYIRDLMDEFTGALDSRHTIGYSVQDVSNPVMVDPVLVGYIVRNLVSNAIKYSPDGGNIRLELAQSGKQISIRIQDEGIGIPLDSLDKLFDAYHRAENVGQIRGTGLGLRIVKDCVELHGGHIEVSSELNRGTTFIVTLETA